MISRRKFPVRPSLIALAVLALMALAAPAAHAYEWAREGSTFEALGLKEESVSGSASGNFTLEVASLSIEIRCESASVSGAVAKGGTGSLTVELTKCKVFTTEGEELGVCVTESPMVIKAKSEQIEVKGALYELFVPSGTAFTTVKFASGKGCPLPLKTEVVGSMAAALEEAEKLEHPLVFSKAASEAAGSKLLFGKNLDFPKGTLTRALAGASKGQKWGPSTTVICKAKPTESEGTLICPKGEAYSGKFEAKMETGSKATFESTEGPAGTISCTEAKLEGEINTTGSGTVTTEAFHSGGGGPCTSTLAGNPTVEIEYEELPFKFTTVFAQVGAPQGQVQPPPVRFANFTIGGMTCVYKILMPNWAWTNGPPPGWILQQGYELVMGTVPPCPALMIQNTFVPPAPPAGGNLYVARR